MSTHSIEFKNSWKIFISALTVILIIWIGNIDTSAVLHCFITVLQNRFWIISKIKCQLMWHLFFIAMCYKYFKSIIYTKILFELLEILESTDTYLLTFFSQNKFFLGIKIDVPQPKWVYFNFWNQTNVPHKNIFMCIDTSFALYTSLHKYIFWPDESFKILTVEP